MVADVPAPPPAPRAERARLASAVILGTVDARVSGTDSRTVARLRPGGLVLFARHFADGGATVRRALAAAGPPRPLLLVDQEGGEVRRLPDLGPAAAPALGRQAPGATFASYRRAAQGLRRAGIAVDLAPVADVARPGGVMARRSFAARPSRVGAHVVAALRGLAAGGVAGCVKHFPGLGAVAVNTDHAVGYDRRPRAQVLRDLAPFAAAINAGVPCVMVSNVVVPALCPRPAVLCPGTYRRLRALGFRGAIVTDSLNARGLAPWGTPPALAVRALRAGADGPMITGPGSTVWTAYAVRRALADGRLDAARLRRSALRIRALAQP